MDGQGETVQLASDSGDTCVLLYREGAERCTEGLRCDLGLTYFQLGYHNELHHQSDMTLLWWTLEDDVESVWAYADGSHYLLERDIGSTQFEIIAADGGPFGAPGATEWGPIVLHSRP